MIRGQVIEESLTEHSALELVDITETVVEQISEPAPGQSATWTVHTFEVDEEDGLLAGRLARSFSETLKEPGWYVSFTTPGQVFVIFPGRVFQYNKGDFGVKAAAHVYGKSVGIPAAQLDWPEE